jgi:hypothetical protein
MSDQSGIQPVTTTLDDDQVLDYTQRMRRSIVAELTKSGVVPSGNADRNMLMNALDGLDRAAINNKRIKVDSAAVENDALAASIIAKLLNQVQMPKRNDDDVIDIRGVDMSLPSSIPEPSLVPYETEVNPQQLDYDSFMSKVRKDRE